MKDDPNNYLCYPSDEAISLIYLAYQLQFKRNELEKPKVPGAALHSWLVEKPKTTQLLASIEALEELKFPGSPTEGYLSEIGGLVGKTFSVLFPVNAIHSNE